MSPVCLFSCLSHLLSVSSPVCLMFPFCLMPPVSCLLSVSRLLSVFRLLSVLRLLSHIHGTVCLSSPVCLMSVSHLLSHVSFSGGMRLAIISEIKKKFYRFDLYRYLFSDLMKPISGFRLFSCFSALSGLSGLKHYLFWLTDMKYSGSRLQRLSI